MVNCASNKHDYQVVVIKGLAASNDESIGLNLRDKI